MRLQEIIKIVNKGKANSLSIDELLQAQQHFASLCNMLEFHYEEDEDLYYKFQNSLNDVGRALKERFETNYSISRI